MILKFSQCSRSRRREENEVCIEKLLKTLACVADGGSQQCFNLMGQREGERGERYGEGGGQLKGKFQFSNIPFKHNVIQFSLVCYLKERE